MVGKVVALFRAPSHLSEQVGIAKRHARVIGERLERCDVLGRPVAGRDRAIGDLQRSGDTRYAGNGCLEALAGARLGPLPEAREKARRPGEAVARPGQPDGRGRGASTDGDMVPVEAVLERVARGGGWHHDGGRAGSAQLPRGAQDERHDRQRVVAARLPAGGLVDDGQRRALAALLV